MMDQIADLLPLFQREFELCKVKEGEVVAVITEPGTRNAYSSAAAAASRALGAEVFEVSVPGMGWDAPTIVKGMGMSVPALAKPSPLLDAVKEALLRVDFIVDLVPETILHVPIREDLLAAGKRVLTIVDPPEVLERMFPSPEVKEAALSLRKKVAEARTLRLTSEAGTDIEYELLPGSGVCQYGYADEPGRWDHWPSALVSSYPDGDNVNGTVVLAPGDMLFPFKRYVESTVTLHVEDGYVSGVEGGLEAALIKDFLDGWREPEVWAVSHVAFGVHPRAQWNALWFYEKDGMIGMDARSLSGAFLFSTGPNRYIGRWVEAHLDIPMRNVTAHLDGEAVVTGGELVEPKARG